MTTGIQSPASGTFHDRGQEHSDRFGLLRQQRRLRAVERVRHATDAGEGVGEAGRAVSADQVTAGLGQEPGADVHRARQAAQPGHCSGDHRRARTDHRRELRGRKAERVRILGRLDRRSEMESLQRAGRRRRQGQRGEGRFWTATTGSWSAPTPPSASPWTGSARKRSTVG